MTTINSCSTHSCPSGSRSRHQRRRDQHGQAALEMALLLPLLLLLLFGIIMTSFILYASIQVTNAAREGARAGSVYPLTMANSGLSLDQTVKNAIYNPGATPPQTALGYLSTSSPSFSVATDVVCTLNGSTCTNFTPSNPPRPGDQLIVRVTYRYTVPVLSVMLPMFPQPITFAPSVTMELQ